MHVAACVCVCVCVEYLSTTCEHKVIECVGRHNKQLLRAQLKTAFGLSRTERASSKSRRKDREKTKKTHTSIIVHQVISLHASLSSRAHSRCCVYLVSHYIQQIQFNSITYDYWGWGLGLAVWPLGAFMVLFNQ